MIIRQQRQTGRQHSNNFTGEMTMEKRADWSWEWATGSTGANDFIGSEKDDSIYYLFFDKKNTTQVTLLRQSRKAAGLEITKFFAPDELFGEEFKKVDSGPKETALHLNSKYIDWLYTQFDSTCQAPNVFH